MLNAPWNVEAYLNGFRSEFGKQVAAGDCIDLFRMWGRKGGQNQPRKLPPGTPPWITLEDIDETLRVWQQFSKERLSDVDAVEIMVNVRNLLELMFLKDRHK